MQTYMFRIFLFYLMWEEIKRASEYMSWEGARFILSFSFSCSTFSFIPSFPLSTNGVSDFTHLLPICTIHALIMLESILYLSCSFLPRYLFFPLSSSSYCRRSQMGPYSSLLLFRHPCFYLMLLPSTRLRASYMSVPSCSSLANPVLLPWTCWSRRVMYTQLIFPHG